MRCPAAVLLVATGLASCAGDVQPDVVDDFGPAGPRVRVSILRAPRVQLSSLGEVILRQVETGGRLAAERVGGALVATARDGELVLGGTEGLDAPPHLRRVLIDRSDADGPFELSSVSGARQPKRYRGDVELRAYLDEVEVVNVLSLEEYLLGVVGAEMPALYPRAALEAQCVASRTYALFALRRAAAKDLAPAVFAATHGFQVYRGVEIEHTRVRQALSATRGQVLHFDDGLFRTYFHSTCGGMTASAARRFGEPDIEPLRGVTCGACDDSRFASWTSTLTPALVDQAWRSHGGPGSGPGPRTGSGGGAAVRELSIVETFADGRASSLEVRLETERMPWNAARFRQAMEAVRPGSVRSTAFTIESLGDAGWRLHGKGWGHGVGLCQVGARGLAKKGLDSVGILAHYYPGSQRHTDY